MSTISSTDSSVSSEPNASEVVAEKTSGKSETTFKDLSLAPAVLQTLEDLGYANPTPIQALTIPYLLQGRDVVGQAQTGTGKTAAFALPLLSLIDPSIPSPQSLILAPTRELAIQVCEALEKYSSNIDGFRTMPIYGGQDYGIQLRALRRGVHVVVGTPGRVMDHMRRGTLKLDQLRCLILDEADEMLRMGFVDDIEWILEQSPVEHQIALFSATMPPAIRRIAQKYLTNPEELTIKTQTTTAVTIDQRYWPVQGHRKYQALSRILEGETTDGMLVFVRTKAATVEVAEKLAAQGYKAAALNGDIPQNQRERTVERLKKGQLDIVVATDVAARGLDVQRISHVINYDLPRDPESYTHRIGRTGRAGRSGVSIAFVTRNENHLLRQIERTTRQKINQMELPTVDQVNKKRVNLFKEKMTKSLQGKGDPTFQEIIQTYLEENPEVQLIELATALARMSQGDKPLLLKPDRVHEKPSRDGGKFSRDRSSRDQSSRDRGPRQRRERKSFDRSSEKPSRFNNEKPKRNFEDSKPEKGMERFRLQVGRHHGVKPKNIVGAIANEAGLSHSNIGKINIYENFSTVDLPSEMPREVFKTLKRVRVSGQQLRITRSEGSGGSKKKKFRKSKND